MVGTARARVAAPNGAAHGTHLDPPPFAAGATPDPAPFVAARLALRAIVAAAGVTLLVTGGSDALRLLGGVLIAAAVVAEALATVSLLRATGAARTPRRSDSPR